MAEAQGFPHILASPARRITTPPLWGEGSYPSTQTPTWPFHRGGGEPRLLALLLLTFAKPLPLRGPKRTPLQKMPTPLPPPEVSYLTVKKGSEVRSSPSLWEILSPAGFWRLSPQTSLRGRAWQSPHSAQASLSSRKNRQPNAALQLSGSCRLPSGVEHHYYL